MLRRRAVATPDRIVFTFLPDGEQRGGQLSFSQLDSRAARIAGRLRHSFHRGDRLLIVAPNSFEFVTGFFGCLYAGLIAVPVEMPRSERALPRFLAVADDAGPSGILTSADTMRLMGKRLQTDAVLRDLKVVLTDDPGPESVLESSRPQDLAYLQYTSGSTATPKGVMITHVNVLSNLEYIDREFAHDEYTAGLSWLPHYHDMGLVYGLLQPVYNGFPCYLMPPAAFIQRPARWVEAISRLAITHTGGPNFAYELSVRKTPAGQRASLDLSKWRVAFNGAEPVRQETLDAFAGAFSVAGFRADSFHPSYGLAEATLKVTSRRGVSATVREGSTLVSCGAAELPTDIAIINTETNQPVTGDNTGEIWVTGPGVAAGYWQRSVETESTFHVRLAGDDRHWLRTGDLGFLQSGQLYIAGRIKDLIIIRGVNHYPQDIEATAQSAHPALRPAATAAFSVDSEGQERLVLAAELERGHEEQAPEIIAAVRRAVSEAHELQTRTVVLLKPGALPKTSSGKVQRRLTRQLFETGSLDAAVIDTAGEGLLTGDTQGLKNLVARILGIVPEKVDFDRALTSLGMDSLQAAELASAIDTVYGVQLEIGEALENRPLRELAAMLETASASSPIPVLNTAIARASTEQERLWFLEQVTPGRAVFHIPAAVRLSVELNLERLRAAVSTVMDRQQSLRTVFESQGGRPVQVVMPKVTPPVATAGSLAEAFSVQFDLARGPLFQVSLVGNILAAVFHHTISDVVSAGIFFREVSLAYSGAPLPELPVQFTDFAEWQRGQLDSGELDGHLDYWKRQLEKPPRLRWSNGTGASGQVILELEESLLERVRSFSSAHSVTPSATLLAAFNILLHRLTGQDDLLVGSPASNRQRRELQNVIGFFAYPLLIRADLAGKPAFQELIQQIHETTIEALAHAAAPFTRVAELVPNIQVLFSVAADPAREFEMPEVETSIVPVEPPPTDFDIFVTVLGTRVLLSYNTAALHGDEAPVFLQAFVSILEQGISEAGIKPASFQLPALLEARAKHLRPRHRKRIVAIASTFTSEPVEEPLAFWMDELGLRAEIQFAPYNQVFQSLLNSDSPLGRNNTGFNVVIMRSTDWSGSRTGWDDLAEALRASMDRTKIPHLLVLPSEEAPSSLAASPGLTVIDEARIKAWYPVERLELAGGESLGQVPYTNEYFAAIATSVARGISAVDRRPRKVIAIDCDNTLWTGVCGEDGPLGVEPNVALQQLLLERHNAGYLLCLCSKNIEEDVWAVFDARPDMPLRREHLVTHRLNWNPKSRNLREIAAELGLGLDSFVVLDDNPIECVEISAHLPQVLCVQIPGDQAKAASTAANVWPLDVWGVTQEDRARTELYKQQAERRVFEQQSLTLESFLEGLQLRVDIAPCRPDQMQRISQLTQRTNQFNCTGIRRNLEELGAALASSIECLSVDVSDRFGSYGLVGVLLFRAERNQLLVDTFLLSCRALGRGVEHRMLAELGRIATERNIPEIFIPFRKSERNQPASNFLSAVAGEGNGGYRLPAETAEDIEYKPVATESGQLVEEPALPSAPIEADWTRIATGLQTAQAVLDAIRTKEPQKEISIGSYVAPRTPLERQLAEIWGDILRLPKVSVEADFFEIGGHSLLAVQVLSRVRELIGTELSLDVVFGGAFTISEMAKSIELHEIQAAGADADALLAQIENLSDEEIQRLLNEQS